MMQAENYISMQGVATQPTTDIGLGLNVGWIDLGDWMNYSVNIPSPGYYTFSFRVSTSNDHALFLVSDLTDNRQLFTMAVPNTGGFQNWTTVTYSYYFFDTGNKVLQLRSTNWDIWNINWIYIQPLYPFGGSYGGPTVEAEWYSYESGVQTQPTTDSAGGYNVGWIDINDWMNYYIYADSTGRYNFGFRVATPYDNASFEVLDNTGKVLATVNVPNTGGLQNWQTVHTSIDLPAGVDTIWVQSTSWEIWNFNWFTFVGAGDTGSTATTALRQATTAVDAQFAANTTLWPNPIEDVFTINMNDTLAGKVMVQIVDGAGVLRQHMEGEKTPGATAFSIPAGSLLPGIYYVRIIVGNQVQVRKVLKL